MISYYDDSSSPEFAVEFIADVDYLWFMHFDGDLLHFIWIYGSSYLEITLICIMEQPPRGDCSSLLFILFPAKNLL